MPSAFQAVVKGFDSPYPLQLQRCCMQVSKELETWFKNKIKELIETGTKMQIEAGDTPHSYSDAFESFRYVADTLCLYADPKQRVAAWFSVHGCPVFEKYDEKYHLMARVRDNSITYKDIFPH